MDKINIFNKILNHYATLLSYVPISQTLCKALTYLDASVPRRKCPLLTQDITNTCRLKA